MCSKRKKNASTEASVLKEVVHTYPTFIACVSHVYKIHLLAIMFL